MRRSRMINNILELLDDKVIDFNDLNKILEKLDSINDGIDELHSKLDDMQGIGLYNSISDVHDKLEEIKNTVEQI